MPLFDLPLDDLRRYRTRSSEPPDLDEFWARGLAHARELAREPDFEPYREAVYGALAVDDVTFSGGDGHPIKAWFVRPRAVSGRLPCLVEFRGYGGGRSLPVAHTLYAAAGYATFVMDSRSQGGWGGLGATGDPGAGSSGPEHPGVMTRGIADPETYYYRRLYLDAVRAVETARSHPQVDPERIAVGGGSQGGGLSLAAAALAPELVRLCHADVPFLCDIERGMEIGPELPYLELARFLSHHVEHPLVHRLRPPGLPRASALPRQRRADGLDLPAVDRVRRLDAADAHATSSPDKRATRRSLSATASFRRVSRMTGSSR